MNCPKCGSKTSVCKTEKFDRAVERTRVCSKGCMAFETSENITEIPSDKEGADNGSGKR